MLCGVSNDFFLFSEVLVLREFDKGLAIVYRIGLLMRLHLQSENAFILNNIWN